MSIQIDQRVVALEGEVSVLKAAHIEHVAAFNELSNAFAAFKANVESMPVHTPASEPRRGNGRG